jgi:hypothetical protein
LTACNQAGNEIAKIVCETQRNSRQPNPAHSLHTWLPTLPVALQDWHSFQVLPSPALNIPGHRLPCTVLPQR